MRSALVLESRVTDGGLSITHLPAAWLARRGFLLVGGGVEPGLLLALFEVVPLVVVVVVGVLTGVGVGNEVIGAGTSGKGFARIPATS